MADLSENFWHVERRCKCGCGTEVDRPELTARLEQARKVFSELQGRNTPLVINSWCRCAKHNEREGGVDSSAHVGGWAVDIRCGASRTKFNLRKALLAAGFTRFGTGKTFLHVDMDPTKPGEVEWVYS